MTDMTPIVRIRNVTKRFGKSVVAVSNFSLDIQEGEFFALLGPSGCGKTTLLRMIAGFENPTEGQIFIDGNDVQGIEPNRRPVNMVFQSYAVFPHMTVAKNVGYGLKVTGTPSGEIKKRVAEALSLVKMDGYDHRMPHQLSGGQQQRVALARALVKRPRVLLLDEPLSALDAKLREAVHIELSNLQKTVGITFVIVTHAQTEALSLADKIAIMNEGELCQTASPKELYERPNSKFCADFIGKANLLNGKTIGVEDNRLLVDVKGIGQIKVPTDVAANGIVDIAIRPEKLRLSKEEPKGDVIKFRAKVDGKVYYGNSSTVYFKGNSDLRVLVDIKDLSDTGESSIEINDEMWVYWQPEDTLVLTK